MDTISSTTANPPPILLDGPKLTLLIVDDEDGPRKALAVLFRKQYNILMAGNGAEAMEIIMREKNVDVVVTDILMPIVSGPELLKLVKDYDATIEVIMLTAFETVETARQAIRYGASDYLNKPYDIVAMRAAVSRAAEKRTMSLAFRDNNDILPTLQKELQDYKVREEMARTHSDIYASVLHDINSPLSVISGYIELLSKTVDSTASMDVEQLDNLRTDLRTMESQVGRCFEISRRYLSFLRPDADEQVKVPVRQILADLRELIIRHPAANGHEFVMEEIDRDYVADINGTDLLQILLNLTINALQAHEKPHRVEVFTRVLDFEPSVVQGGDTECERFIGRAGFRSTPPLIAINVQNSGPGIPQEIFRRMFEERFTTKAVGKGTGLGLSIIRRLAEKAGAGIQFYTDETRGTTLTVVIPAIADGRPR